MKKVSDRTLLSKVQKTFADNWIIVAIWMIVVFSSSLVTLYQGFEILRTYYNQSFASKHNMKKALEDIYPNQQIHVIVEKIGKPEIVQAVNENNEEAILEHIFIDEYFYIQAITDDSNNILSLAITTRDKEFNPEFDIPGTNKNVVLGKSTFYSLFEEPYGGCFTRFGAHNFSYFEGNYLANSGNYQTYYMGVNDAGYLPDEWWKGDGYNDLYNNAMADDNFFQKDGDCQHIPTSYRESAVINTYTITAPFAFSAISKDSQPDMVFGANLNTVRVIPR